MREKEAPQRADLEKTKPVEVVHPVAALKETPAEPRRPGKGGPEHTYLQELIKRWAEEHGFRAAVEEAIAGGRESVDVALYRGDLRIACEITVTTPLEYEVGNVEKCLAAGFGTVAVVSLKKARLAKLGKLLTESLPPDERGRVHLFTPEELLSWLAGQPAREPEVDKLTLDYLALVAASPFLTVRERNRALDLSVWRGQRLKSAILRQGLAREVAINPGGRGQRFKLLDLTAEGRALLARYGVPLATGHGRGGIAHRWWVQRIAAWLAERGMDSAIEDASSGARVDLAFALGSERVAVEIEMGEGHVAANVRKDLAAGYELVVCLVDETVNLDRLRTKLGELPPGVTLGELRAFETVLAPIVTTSSLRRPNQKEEPRRRRSRATSVAPPVPAQAISEALPSQGDAGALSTPAAAEYLGLSPATLETLRTRGGGPAFVKLGRRVVYRREDLEAWLIAQRRSSTSDVQ